MKLIAAQEITDLADFDLALTDKLAPVDNLKVFLTGELAAEKADRRLFIQLNRLSAGYQSYVLMNGHAAAGEWDGRGFYVGRNGWGLDASISVELTISSVGLLQKRTAHGQSTFALGNNNILGYVCHGFLVSNAPISSWGYAITGGTFTGTVKAYAF